MPDLPDGILNELRISWAWLLQAYEKEISRSLLPIPGLAEKVAAQCGSTANKAEETSRMLKLSKNPTTCEVGQVWESKEFLDDCFVFIYGPNCTLVGVRVTIADSGGLLLTSANRYTEQPVGGPVSDYLEFVGMASNDT